MSLLGWMQCVPVGQAHVMDMSIELKEAFGQVAKAKIISGTVDLRKSDQFIECIGKKDGVLYQITCHWVGGFPAWIHYDKLETDI